MARARYGVAAPSSSGCATISRMSVLKRSSRSEEHTSELQSPCNLVCRLLLEKKKIHTPTRLPRPIAVDDRIAVPEHLLGQPSGSGVQPAVRDPPSRDAAAGKRSWLHGLVWRP